MGFADFFSGLVLLLCGLLGISAAGGLGGVLLGLGGLLQRLRGAGGALREIGRSGLSLLLELLGIFLGLLDAAPARACCCWAIA